MPAAGKYIAITLLTLALLLIVTVAGLAAVAQYRPDALTPLVENIASRALGRQLQVKELQEFRLGSDAYLRATGASLANPDWSDVPAMVEVAHLELGLHIPSLWQKGPIVFRSVQASEVTVDLESLEDGRANWQFEAFSGDEEDEDEDSGPPFPVLFEHVDIDSASLRYRDEDQDVHALISSLQLDDRDNNSFSDLQVDGEVNQQPIRITGAIGPAAALQSGENLALDLDVLLGEFKLEARGKFADLATLAGADFDLVVNAPRSRFVLDLLGLEEVRDGPLQFEGHLKDGHPGLLIEARGSLAEFDLDVTGHIEDPAQVDGMDIKFLLDGPSMAEAGAIFGLVGLKSIPYALSGRLRIEGTLLAIDNGVLEAGEGRIELAGQLPHFPSIDDWQAGLVGRNLDMSVLGTVLGTEELPQDRFDVVGKLAANPEGVELLDVHVSGPMATLTLSGMVGEPPEWRDSDLRVEITGQDLSLMKPFLGLQEVPAQPFRATGHLLDLGGEWRLQDAAIRSGHLQMDLNGTLDRLVDPQRVNGEVTFSTGNLPATLAAYGIEPPAMKDVPLAVTGKADMVANGFQISALQGSLADLTFSGNGLLSNKPGLAESRLVLQASGDNLQQVLASATELETPEQPFELDMDVTWHDPLVSFNHLDLKLGGHQLAAVLELREDEQHRSLATGTATLEGASLGKLLAMLGVETSFDEQDYRIETQLAADTRQLSLKKLQFTGKHSDLDGELKFIFGDIPRLDAQLHSSTLSMGYLLPTEEEKAQLVEEEKQQQASASPALLTPPTRKQLEDRIIPETPLPLNWINHINGRWQYIIDNLVFSEDTRARAVLDMEIEDGVLITHKAEWRGTFSDGSAGLSIDARGGDNRFQFFLDSNRIPLLWLVGSSGKPTHDATYHARLSGRGRTLREAAASLNGAVLFSGSGVKVDNRGMDLIMGDALSAVLDRLDPSQEAEAYSTVRCHAGAATITDGLLELNPGLGVRTDQVDTRSMGVIDLKDESLAISFRTRPRKGLGISAAKAVTPYMILSGNMAHPYMTVDPQGVVVTGGAAIATGGLSLIAETVWSRWKTTQENPCEKIVVVAAEESSGVYEELLPGAGD